MKHLLALEGANRDWCRAVLNEAAFLKAQRRVGHGSPLAGQIWALMFSKSSTRTRVSFEVGISELGGRPLFLNANDIQLGRGEPIKDTARVLGRMVHGAIIRTFAQNDVDEFARYSGLPTVNALTDDEHPCQILTDIFTYEEKRGPIQGKRVVYLGDAACNVPRSWMHAAELFDFELILAAPEAYQPTVTNRHTRCLIDPVEAVRGADLLYTDVWVSMGKEAEAADRIAALQAYQLNHDLVRLASNSALVLHCLPAYREKEITDALLEERSVDIFDQAENRLHVQKAILVALARAHYPTL